MKPLKIYICGKYSSDNILGCLKNIARLNKTASELFELGFAPFSPAWDMSFVINNPEGQYTKDMFYDASMVWLECSDAVYVISGVGDKGGVDAEIVRAEKLYIPVFYDVKDLLRWARFKFL